MTSNTVIDYKNLREHIDNGYNFKIDDSLNLEEILSLIEDDLLQIACDKTILPIFIDTRDADILCQAIGKGIVEREKVILDLCQRPFNKDLNVYITGALYSHGGHTREIEDWINTTYNNQKNIIIVSYPIKNSHEKQLDRLKAQNIQVIYNNSKYNRIKYIKWLQRQLAELRPGAIFVSTTPNDIVSLSALQPQLINKLYWNLSLDHGISIGLHIKSITSIIAKRPYLYFYLKDRLKLPNIVYIPLNRPDVIGEITHCASVNGEKKIITGSCTSAAHKIESSYKYKFTEIIPNILKITGGTHIHIGAISENDLINLYFHMDKLKVMRNKFIIISWVESLAKALIENNVDVLVQTFPIGGGLVSIEAMEAGKMLINHKNYGSYLSNLSDFCYDGAFSWSKPRELYDYLRKLTREEIIKYSKISRKHYETYHMSENLKEVMSIDNLIGINIEDKAKLIADEYNYAIDFYQKYFDDLGGKNSSTPAKSLCKLCNNRKKSFVEKFKNSYKKRLNKIFLLTRKILKN